MKKKRFIIIASILCIGSILIFGNKGAHKDVVLLDAKTDGFHSFEELDDSSPIIIKGKKVDVAGTNIFRSKINNIVAGGYTKSEFEIAEVFKNSDNNPKIQPNQRIVIMEHSFKDAVSNKTYTVNGYMNMANGEEYLLFLNNEEEGLFAICGVIFGKIPLTKKSEIYGRFLDKDFAKGYTDIMDKAKQKYMDITQ